MTTIKHSIVIQLLTNATNAKILKELEKEKSIEKVSGNIGIHKSIVYRQAQMLLENNLIKKTKSVGYHHYYKSNVSYVVLIWKANGTEQKEVLLIGN